MSEPRPYRVVSVQQMREPKKSKAVRPQTDVEVIDPEGLSGWWIALLSDQAREGLAKWRERER